MATAVQPECSTASFQWPTREAVVEKLRDARHAVTMARHSAEDLAADTVSTVRRHPLRAIGGAMAVGAAVGAAVGSLAGLYAGREMRRPRRRWEW